MPTQEYTISHTGTVLEDAGEDAVWLYNNQISPQRETEIAEFRCPDNFDMISWVGNRDPVRFEPRTHEALSVSSGTLSLSTDIQPVAGETELDEQPYPVVEVFQGGSVVPIESVDYAANEVNIDTSGFSTGDDFHCFPIITDGTLKMRGENALNQHTGPLFPWGFPLYRFHDFRQDKRGSEINLNGGMSWERNETLQVLVDSGTEVVWEHTEHPEAYVTMLEIDCRITF